MVRTIISLIAVCLLWNGILSTGQQTHQSRLATPRHWNYVSEPVFEDDVRNVRFYLATSWIPGVDHRGSMRFQIVATAAPPGPDDPPEWKRLDTKGETAKFLKRTMACSFTLRLEDSGGFVLAEVPLFLGEGVDGDGNLADLQENSATKLDATMYEAFLRGRFEIGWVC